MEHNRLDKSQSSMTRSPVEFILDDITPLIDMDVNKIAAQRAFAKKMGYVQYALGHDPSIAREIVAFVTSVYGEPKKMDLGQLVWTQENPNMNSGLSSTITMTVYMRDHGCFFIKADARKVS
ncbi:MAG: hypothetical protein ACSHXY_08975 [Alphaproteobacteria bacterium]